MSGQRKQGYIFGQFRLDLTKRLLFEGDEIIALTPKSFDTLLVLVENRGSVLSKDELMRLVWPDQFVEENNLAQNIHLVRKLLRDGTGEARYIETIPKRGYRFVAQVEALEEPVVAADDIVAIISHQLPGGSLPAFIKPKTQYATGADQVNIAYQVVGEGPLDLVFVMGWVSNLEYFWLEPSFARFLARLASFSRLILFDKRGTGLSDPVPVSDLPTLEQRMTDVQVVLDAVGSRRAALLGVSDGGPMCALFAATYPERTSALVMIGTYAKRTRSADYPWAPTEEEYAVFLEEIRKDWGGPVGIVARAPSVAYDPQFREWWAAYLRCGASPGAALALTQMNAEIDMRNVFPSIRVPTLVLHRTDDACLPAGGGRYIASLIPGAKYVELEGRDHLPFIGDQDEILSEIEEFLTGARPDRRIDRVLTTALFVLFDDTSPQPSAESRELHRAYIRREIALSKGKEAAMTDAYLFATFDGPARAIRCALRIVEASARFSMQTRAGLHTGECDVLGERVSGVTVELGWAVARCARPREVWLSHTVKDLVAGSGIEFDSRGERKFEYIPGEWRLFTAKSSAGC
jgi:DNA-binding winged helix-turn-helix (wHTH) protein/pimeloyl-ACP methyl ester carboxylesterase